MPTRKVASAGESNIGRSRPTRRGLKTEAVAGFLLHCLTYIQATAISTRVLGAAGFSLTKQRILGLATLSPGVTVGEVVTRLRISHQGVNGPLRQLIKEGYVVAKIGVEDRRHKRLFATPKGSRRYVRSHAENVAKMEAAFRAAGPEAVRGFLEVHKHLVGPEDHEWAERASRFFVQIERKGDPVARTR